MQSVKNFMCFMLYIEIWLRGEGHALVFLSIVFKWTGLFSPSMLEGELTD